MWCGSMFLCFRYMVNYVYVFDARRVEKGLRSGSDKQLEKGPVDKASQNNAKTSRGSGSGSSSSMTQPTPTSPPRAKRVLDPMQEASPDKAHK